MDEFEEGGDDIASSFDDGDEDAGEEKATNDDDTETADAEDPDYLDDDAPARFGHLQRSAYDDLSAPEKVSKWHSSLLPTEVDLIVELDGSNLFFINAESVLIEFLYSEEVHFEEDAQFLRLTHAIEFLLHGIKSCGGSFRLVFFDSFKKVFSACFSDSVWAFRQALLCHCRTNGIDHAVFSHWYSAEWKAHVTEWRPSFFLVANDILEPNYVDEEEEEEKQQAPLFAETFRALLLSCLSMKCHVALTRGLQRRGNRMMGFTVQADCYDGWVDQEAKAAYMPMLDEEDDEEDEEEADVMPTLLEYSSEVEDKHAVLRSYLTVKFCKDTLQACEGQNAVTVQLMNLTVKVLLLQEMLLRQLPLDKRAYSIPPAEDWKFYQETIAEGALPNYFSLIVKVLAKLLKEDPQGMLIDSCDLFDGRLYRHVFHIVVAQAEETKGKVGADFFAFKDFVTAELELLWKKVGSKDKFFPLDLTDILGFEQFEKPPEMPPQEGVRPKAQLQPYDNVFLAALWKDFDFDRIDEQNATSAAVGCQLWEDPYGWYEHGKIDSIKAEEFMEENAAEKKLRLKLEAKGKITAADLEFERKFKLKTRQQALKALAAYAKSLTGSDKLHHPIIMPDEKKEWSNFFEESIDKKREFTSHCHESVGKHLAEGGFRLKEMLKQSQEKGDRWQSTKRELQDYCESLKGKEQTLFTKTVEFLESPEDKALAKKDEPAKTSKKQQEILDKRMAEEEAKTKASDAENLKAWDKPIDALAEINDPEKFEKEILDMLCGFNRITDSFERFPIVTNTFKTSDAQAKCLVKVVKACRNSLKKMQLDRLPAAQQTQARRIVQYFFCIIQEAFKSYGLKDIDGKGIKLFQECLIAIGFPKCAKAMFTTWCEAQKKEEPTEEANTTAATDKKDDKKKGKDSKDDKKKDDKKGKSDEKAKKDDGKKDKDDKKDKKSKDKDKDKDDDGDAADIAQFEVKKEVDALWSGVGSDEMAFQMMHLGPYMTRAAGTQKDPRVAFKPDAWQRDLLDIVDDRKSALIVAPTASGKTFIGYYVMDKVLREDNDGVVVYVAPSKALVNQVSAEIYARFSSKTYPPEKRRELMGVFLREYNSAGGVKEAGKWKNCQVLVTIPHILEQLLLSHSQQDWVKRLKWIVFDEVHCIGEQEGGVQWEHTMQAIPCPFIALSATVADPGFFHGWLNKVAVKKGTPEVKIVQYSERWNDLYKYIFSRGSLRPLHPFCCLVEQSVRKNGLASDMTLTPSEMVQLYLQVHKVIGKNKIWDPLAPADYFVAKNIGCIVKRDARQYEKLLKESFLQILADGAISTEAFEKIVVGLQQDPALQGETPDAAKFQPPARTGEDEMPDFRSLSKATTYLKGEHIVRLCRELDQKQYLPAIVFNFNRKEIETALKRMVQELKDQQHNKYYGDEDATYRSRKIMAQRMAEYERKKVEYEQAVKAKASMNQEGSAARKNNDGEGGRIKDKGNNDLGLEAMHAFESMAEPLPPTDLADEIDLEFSFHSPKAMGQWREDIIDQIKDLERRKIPKHLLDGLERGIGMHHEGCTTQYKQAVEVLFRRGYLRVVFATNTLALGINMPCRSTIFCGDSLDLNGLAFRQMSGRAGRRGFDLLGQVVFLDMSFLKVRRLIASDLSKLTGEFTLSPTTLLRVLSSYETLNLEFGEQGKIPPRSNEELARCFAPMFSLPFYSSPGADLDVQVPYHTRFSLELLRKEGLIDTEGRTRGLANMVLHLFEVEPANFVLNRLLASGLLHEYLTQEKEKVKKGQRRTDLTVKLTAILAWFLFPRRLPRSYARSQPRKKHLPSEGCPCLPPLPQKILEEVKNYNEGVSELFQELAFSVASTRKYDSDDFTLPFSGRCFPDKFPKGNPFGAKDDKKKDKKKEPDFLAPYIGQQLKFRARTPFAALAGEGDRFRSPADLVTTVRNVIQMDLNAIPMVTLKDTNSWALDFMIHGKMKVLWEDNGIDATSAWKLLKEFEDIVRMLIDAIKVYKPSKEDIVLTTFEELAAELAARRDGH
mmetsp:Transcript_33055/g.51346  ORF Transcript_33055/g.51346 Transcript_33055/m.51346 type:complete len:2017 (-) Transcript_33055:221-6271(-)